MSQVFTPSANTISRTSITVLIWSTLIVSTIIYFALESSYKTGVGVAIEQPVPFSHQHHVGGLGLDCRYCHTSVEKSSFAGLPPTATCMNCHSQVWTDAALLQPVRDSWKTGKPISWTRVHDVPDYAHFNHSIHIAKGVGCATCHGRVDKMPLMWKDQTLFMKWCLDCHRGPEQYLRPKTRVFDLAWERPTDPEGLAAASREAGLSTTPATAAEFGQALVQKYGINKDRLDNCSVCHR